MGWDGMGYDDDDGTRKHDNSSARAVVNRQKGERPGQAKTWAGEEEEEGRRRGPRRADEKVKSVCIMIITTAIALVSGGGWCACASPMCREGGWMAGSRRRSTLACNGRRTDGGGWGMDARVGSAYCELGEGGSNRKGPRVPGLVAFMGRTWTHRHTQTDRQTRTYD
ncbi:hypothetical protein K505DRAFT_162383 [Melanomma pulvis-pyrius CBS 109.77]|uniref:Uncharacterized protein n=1 Tax=Melanomma pulvis-pyrius CBS 109.77 TaxID=1314802 RepID=A0A6A6XJ20_9PLEO|nr:hypothetical protein K505DRAFT_162383 [Melanomma pulvis-pyrius CBS 109.77]